MNDIHESLSTSEIPVYVMVDLMCQTHQWSQQGAMMPFYQFRNRNNGEGLNWVDSLKKPWNVADSEV